jgi:diguanylate cyclase (GGDEF)-like protein
LIKPELPANEPERLQVLRALDILDSPPEKAFDDLTLVASTVCGTKMAAVVLVDEDRQWFKAAHGVPRESGEATRDISFCAHAILRPEEILMVEDTLLDQRFHDNPMVTAAPPVRFYAGAPLVTGGGAALGSLCVFDALPAQLSQEQRQALQALSRQASQLLELRSISLALQRQLREREWYEQQLGEYYTQLETQNADLAEQTRTDPLTGLPNRRAFTAALAAAMGQAQQGGAPVSVAMIDIDHFTTINDFQGHDVGDQVLVALAALLRAHAAGRGMISRFGGEEFVVLMPGAALDQARMQCEYLREEVALMSINLPITVSIGVAELRPGEGAEQGIKRADTALYAAKRGGRDQVVCAE